MKKIVSILSAVLFAFIIISCGVNPNDSGGGQAIRRLLLKLQKS